MYVTIISECKSKSKINTRRTLSSYLYQIGRNVWQGQISSEGLNDLKIELEKKKPIKHLLFVVGITQRKQLQSNGLSVIKAISLKMAYLHLEKRLIFHTTHH